MPANIQQPLRRRGAVSAEPINEEDAATYVKKVRHTVRLYVFFKSVFLPFPLNESKRGRRRICKKKVRYVVQLYVV